ncbi:hypothetical protein ACP275_06G128400 [Erythranthe tilingii]
MAPSPSKPTTVHHSADPKHPLHLLLNTPTEFLCSGCSAPGFGTRYRCNDCDIDLHDFCATCPATTESDLHPTHPLTLVSNPANDRVCDLCGDTVEGLFYTCAECGFDVHPLCTQLPLHAHLPQHGRHLLKLQPGKSAACALCFKGCPSWRYRCDACCLDVHLECVLAVDVSSITVAAPYLKRSESMPPHIIGIPIDEVAVSPATVGKVEEGEASSKGSKKKKNIYSTLGRITVAAVSTSLIGVPIILKDPRKS